ncbi:hypothetical protein SGPA1_21117 [Streptomyces misionensis JCM 4497]
MPNSPRGEDFRRSGGATPADRTAARALVIATADGVSRPVVRRNAFAVGRSAPRPVSGAENLRTPLVQNPLVLNYWPRTVRPNDRSPVMCGW